MQVDYAAAEHAIDLPHHQAAPFKNYTLSKSGTVNPQLSGAESQFVSFQPVVPTAKSRAREHRQRMVQELDDPTS